MENDSTSCGACGALCAPRQWDISSWWSRVNYKGPIGIDEVEVGSSWPVAVFCSENCLNLCRDEVMDSEGVPLPTVQPGIEPTESCALCQGPVDMSNWHVTYVEMEGRLEGLDTLRHINSEYLAVLCTACKPLAPGQESEFDQADPPQHPSLYVPGYYVGVLEG